MLDLSIIIVSFNTKKLLTDCLKSLMVDGRWLETKGEIIVVDNGSSDGSVEEVRKFKIQNPGFKIRLIENEENLGFAKANNQGIKIAKGKYILLLNSDTEVKPGVLEELVKFVQNHPEAGVVGARLLNPDGSIQPSVYHFPTILGAIKEFWLGWGGSYEKYPLTGTNPVIVEAVTGAAMLIPRRTVEKIGYLDERYFLYFEDLDYCRRAKKAGLKVFYLPCANFVHHHGASGKKIPGKTTNWLIESSKKYNGRFKYEVLTAIIWTGQKIRKYLFKEKKS